MRIHSGRNYLKALMLIIATLLGIFCFSFTAFAENSDDPSNIITDTTDSRYSTECNTNGTFLVDDSFVNRFVESFPEEQRPLIKIALIVLSVAGELLPIILIICGITIITSFISRIHSAYEAKRIMQKYQKRDKEKKAHEKK